MAKIGIFKQGRFLSTLLLLVPASLAFAPSPHRHCFVAAETSSSSSSSTATSPTSTTTALCSSNQVDNMAKSIPQWFQHEISITAPSRGCHLITSEVNKAIQSDMSGIKMGMANLFIQHTSASLTINENADPDVRRDMEVALNKIVPGKWTRDGTFLHTMEGEDDMPGHVKSSLMGPSLNIPIRNGRLALGTWQGIYLNEHRDQGGWGGGHTRRIIITLQGQS
eukprot:CAMPEP_0172534814 /NCGR_PEP_ID=MMETSP1067-20121228/7061_1 /TAXON_ID=265564 ORGANISM="Thalassiosira punctigera, Strain Tpunct2005C2" /NCGR_SAMPLE_ID=MMETSP1067 /ASSEMBLY_ACC=CAM_ASM_000444 /LENGTH=222 /DNA_ID=CAMNT_0013319659 /DNA_START=50 /DNA_END=718 /DNA_ORIENTATION=+